MILSQTPIVAVLYRRMIFERQNRNIVAEDLVKAAVSANKLPTEVLQDQDYLSAVKLQLTSLSRDFSY